MMMWILIIGVVALLVAAGIWIDHRGGISRDYAGAHQSTAKKGTASDSMPNLEGPSL